MAIVDLVGKGGRVRTVPVPNWVKCAVDDRTGVAGISAGKVFRRCAVNDRIGIEPKGCSSPRGPGHCGSGRHDSGANGPTGKHKWWVGEFLCTFLGGVSNLTVS